MTRFKRLRRVGILCCHCLRNLAYYRAGRRDYDLIFKDQFWVTTNGNFLDICVLEWCKLFGDQRGKHHWKKVISKKEKFFNELLNELEITEEKFDSYIDVFRTYRDKFVAHLDSENTAYPPGLEIAKNSTIFLYNYLLAHEEIDNCFYDAPKNAAEFFCHLSREGKAIYNN